MGMYGCFVRTTEAKVQELLREPAGVHAFLERVDEGEADEDAPAGLGEALLAAVDDALMRIAESPPSFPRDRFDDRARRALVSRFPYAIVFVVHEADVRIVAFAHAKRLPGYWLRRVRVSWSAAH
jgi:hypothetical protein